MNNLKRVLSMGLTGAMLAGMMVVGASAADFKDADEIEHTDAVNTLVALNVINGKDDGSYDPDGIVTRAEMAKLITVTLNGGKDPVIGTKATPSYTDIDGHWAESYIEYCSNLKIINGRGDGTFAPDATVTGSEAAKMMLVAMGWDSTIFNFTGADWALNVGIEANKVKLYEDLEDVDVNEGLTRDDTAQLVYNGILANIMEKDPSMTITNGEITWGYKLSTTKTLFTEKFGGKVWIGTFLGNKQTGNTTTDGQIAVEGCLESNINDSDEGLDTAKFPADFDIANIGEEVKVLFKDGTSGSKGEPDKYDTIYGVFNTGKTEVINATKADIGDSKSDTKLKIDGTNYSIAKDGVAVYTNYVTAADDATVKASADNAKAVQIALKYSNGDTIKFVCDDNGDISAAYVVEYTLGYVTAVNNEKVTTSVTGAIKIADNDIYDGVKKNDIVVVTSKYAGDDKTYTVEKAQVVSGEVTGYKTTTADDGVVSRVNVTVDGTAYKIYNQEELLVLPFTNDEVKEFKTGHITEDFDLYLVNGYVAAAIQTSESASNYSVVTAVNNKKAGGVFETLQIQVLNAEGTKTILTVDKDGATDMVVGDIITWTGTTDEALVKIEAKWVRTDSDGDSAVATSGTTLYSKSTKSLEGVVTTSDCVLFAVTDGAANKNSVTEGSTFKAYSIRSLGTIPANENGTRYTVVTDNDDKAVAVFANLGSVPAGATSNTVYGIVSSYTGTIEIDDVEYRHYTVESNDETYTVNLKTGTLTVGSVVKFEPTSDSCYDKVSGVFTALSSGIYVKEYNEVDGTISYYTADQIEGKKKDGTTTSVESEIAYWGPKDNVKPTTLAVDDDVVIVYVNTDDDVAGSEIGVNPFDSVSGKANAILVTNSAGDTVTAIIVETSNTGF